MNTSKVIKLGLLALVTCAGQAASAKCLIRLSLCKKMGIHQPTTFFDTLAGVDVNPELCLRRARDYFVTCNSNQEVGAEYYSSGVLTVSAYANSGGVTMWTKNAAGQWIRLSGKY